MPAHEGVLDLRFVDDGRRLISAGLEGRVMEWDVETLEGRTLLTVADALAWHVALPAGEASVAVGFSTGAVWVVERKTGAARQVGQHDGTASGGLFFSGAQLISAGEDGVRWFGLSEGRNERVPDLEEAVSSLAALKDGGLVVLGHADGHLTLWNRLTDERRGLMGHTRKVKALAFDPTGHYLASGGWDGLRLWDLERFDSIPVAGHVDAVYGVAFDTTGTLLASASTDRSVRVPLCQ